MGGKSTLKTRSDALDRVFSEFIRRKAADQDGMVRCVTCQKEMSWQKSEAGHFWKRQHKNTRWDPRNSHPQCFRCNHMRGGAEAEYSAFILDTYGQAGFNDLLYQHRQIKKWKREEIESLIL